MGFYSWKYCDDESERMICGKCRNSYLLIPQAFGGGHIVEPCYKGYGYMGSYEVAETVAKWNRGLVTADFLSEPERSDYGADEEGQLWYERDMERYLSDCEMLNAYAGGKSDAFMEQNYGKEWLRNIGILISCDDEDNARLPYPLKIAMSSDAVYENCGPSLRDPLQGCY